MALLENDGNAVRDLQKEDFTKDGEIKTDAGELSLVVGSAVKVEGWLEQKQWNLN